MYNLKTIIKTTLILLSLPVIAQDQPFNCDYSAYLFQNSDVYSIDLASGSSYLAAANITPGSINATGYNSKDGYIWGSLSSPEKSIVRIGNDFSTNIYTINELPTSNRYVGDISPSGIYYLKPGGTTYYIIDLDPASPNYLTSLGTGTLSLNINIHDWAFNAVDNFLYSVEKATNILYRIDASTGYVENLGEVPILAGLNYTYGAVYFDSSGNFYVSSNQTGTIYIINDVTNIADGSSIYSNLFAFGPSSSSNDGARCPSAPVPQENCSNGVDDDGDGLIDCDDPSCSGVSECPIIEPTASGGNEGGLESNSRLSELINQRNFQKIKNGYRFVPEKAKRIVKSKTYGKKNKKNSFTLHDFIPLNVISEEEVIESTPSDLLNITNASEVYSVDYLVNNKNIASILALKTKGKVYEHTKYICDRLLGAEIQSISTIEINNQNFIRSIIKNTDGHKEFVLSFSASTTQGKTDFLIENHWNLDKYSETTETEYYNFQIWSNSIDDLMLLSQEVLRLLEIQKNISGYQLSPPPTVFVKKGYYKNGELNLDIMNVNSSETVSFNAGYKTTETENVNHINSTIKLNKKYLTKVNLNTGKLFDIGFRIGDGINTPDDIFMSDGPWGVDDTAPSTNIDLYKITPNEEEINDTEMAIERNIELSATTKEYISVYKAFTARFKPVNLTNFSNLHFKAEGNGLVEIRLIKSNIQTWEEQYKTSVYLNSQRHEYIIPLNNFSSIKNTEPIFDDVTTIIFTMYSDNGSEKAIKLTLKELKLSNTTLSVDTVNNNETKILIVPNPMSNNTKINFKSSFEQEGTLLIYNQLGQKIKQHSLSIKTGNNTLVIERENMASGIYFIKIKTSANTFNTEKLIIE